mgnify:CR=1 FL=1
MPKLSADISRFSTKIKTPDVHALPADNSYSYFCKYNELSGVIACPGVRLRSLDDSCFVEREKVFVLSPKKSRI